ncbi:glycosyl hydrolase family 65 protein [Pontiella desulfatans]|nr:glycosyl hydrolase family 65 protein [Pontiella desulfatans]
MAYIFSLLVSLSAFGQGSVDDDVTRFEFSDAAASTWVNGYIDSFFTNRVNIENTIFPREYLALSDAWLNGAKWGARSIQEQHRIVLSEQGLANDGYVLTQQHGASSHDHGWPFPHWVQVPYKNGFRGTTAGWHFYDEPKGWEICYAPARGAAPEHFGEAASKTWTLDDLASEGIFEERHAWKLKVSGKLPTLTSPEGVELDSFNCPFIQIRWHAEGNAYSVRPVLEWKCEGDTDWSDKRRMEFSADTIEPYSSDTGMFHSILSLHERPEWNGKITRIRFRFGGLEKGRTLFVRSIFTHWDTRHLVNNSIYIKAAYEYFRWTGDAEFLKQQMPRLRTAMKYMMEEGNGRALNHIRCTWHGHDGRPGYTVNADGTKTFHVGHGKGGNYWDLLPFGWDDMYTTTHYYAALLAMAELEDVTGGDAQALRMHAGAVKKTANEKFFDNKAGRFVGTIDADGIPHDYGFTFVNLEAIHYGIANDANAKRIMEWIGGKRSVEGDTSTGADIYTYRLAPRATTKRNVEWYSFAWTGPETLPFGGQVQDGGAVLGFSFYDVMSRIKTLGADNAWERLMEIRAWDEEVQAYGGYRKYYGDGKGGTTLQGGGTAGGVGIDFEFTESSMLSAVVPFGFMGLRPDGQMLNIEPNLPKDCPQMTVRNLLYQGVPMDVTVSESSIKLVVKSEPATSFKIKFRNEELHIKGAGTFLSPSGAGKPPLR